jgi:hypothetical protein
MPLLRRSGDGNGALQHKSEHRRHGQHAERQQGRLGDDAGDQRDGPQGGERGLLPGSESATQSVRREERDRGRERRHVIVEAAGRDEDCRDDQRDEVSLRLAGGVGDGDIPRGNFNT